MLYNARAGILHRIQTEVVSPAGTSIRAFSPEHRLESTVTTPAISFVERFIIVHIEPHGKKQKHNAHRGYEYGSQKVDGWNGPRGAKDIKNSGTQRDIYNKQEKSKSIKEHKWMKIPDNIPFFNTPEKQTQQEKGHGKYDFGDIDAGFLPNVIYRLYHNVTNTETMHIQSYE